MLDRIDIHIDVPAVRFKDLTGETPKDVESSAAIRERVIRARQRQRERLAGEGIFSNAQMTPRLIRRYCRIDSESERMLERAMARLGLSARAYDRILQGEPYHCRPRRGSRDTGAARGRSGRVSVAGPHLLDVRCIFGTRKR